jgi:3-carboxy-cis,cis-muconate cycloisomerase
MSDRGLFAGLFARGEAAAETSDRAVVQAMLDVEVALLRSLARAGLAPASAAEELLAIADASTFDLAELGRSAGETGTPVPGLLSELRSRGSPELAAHLHRGATSQDILDTATMLVASRALAPTLADLGEAADACAALASEHRATVMPGRTMLQHALPVTFGLKAASWLSGIDGTRRELAEVRAVGLAVQFGGAVGTLAALGDHGLEVAATIADHLGLAQPEISWHTIRVRPTRLAAALGQTLGVMGKIARDVVLLAQTEVGETHEQACTGRGGSSTMPHKHNPVRAVAVIACAERAPSLVAMLFSSMLHEHERAAGAWQAESEPLLELLRLTGSAAAWLRELVDGLQVNAVGMRSDLEATGGLIMSESVATALAAAVGRGAAHDLVERAARRSVEEGRRFREVLLELPEVVSVLGPAGLDAALDPTAYLGVSDELIDRTLAAHRGERWCTTRAERSRGRQDGVAE